MKFYLLLLEFTLVKKKYHFLFLFYFLNKNYFRMNYLYYKKMFLAKKLLLIKNPRY